MPTIINSLLSRRGRKRIPENGLDSVWGDVRITSPTDAIPFWPDLKPKENISVIEFSTAATTNEATLAAVSPHYIKVISNVPSPYLKQASGIARTYGDSIPATSTPAWSINAVQPFRSQSVTPAPQQGEPVCNCSKYATDDTRQILDKTSLSKDDHTGAVAAYNATTLVHGMMTPPMSASVRDKRCAASPDIRNQFEEFKTTVLSHRPLSPNQSPGLVRRPKWVSVPSQVESQAPIGSPYTSLNAAAVEGMHSPVVTVLSPLSESFTVDGGSGTRDGVAGLDSVSNERARFSPPPAVSKPSQYSTNQVHNNSPALSAYSVASHLQRPSTAQNTSHWQAHVFPFRTPSLPQSERFSNNTTHDNQALHTVQSAALCPSGTEVKSADEFSVFGDTLPGNRLAIAGQAGHGQPQNRSSSPASDSVCSRAKSPPLGVTGMMRVQSPPLGVTQMMRVQSPPVSEMGDRATHSRGQSLISTDEIRLGSPYAQDTSRIHRMRRNSLEPPASPSFFAESEMHFPVFSATQSQPMHRRLQSDNIVERSTTSGYSRLTEQLDLAHSFTTTRYAAAPACDDSGMFFKRSRSQMQLESPDLRKRIAFSDSPGLVVEPAFQEAAKGGFYNEVKNDYRTVSREAYAAKVTAVQPVKWINKRDTRRKDSRARSASRARDKSTSRQPNKEKKPKDELVHAYDDLWA